MAGSGGGERRHEVDAGDVVGDLAAEASMMLVPQSLPAAP